MRLTNWSVERALRKRRLRNSAIRNSQSAIVIVRTVANRQVVVAASTAAAGRGIRPGLTLAQARALCADVEHEEHDPAGDAVALEALARWMIRFSPFVSVDAGQPEEVGHEHFGHGLWIDLTGTDRLHGRPQRVVDAIWSSLRRWGVSAHLAVAPTPGAAWAMTFPPLPGGERAGVRGEITENERRSFAVEGIPPHPDPLPLGEREIPVHALRLPADALAALHHLGIRTVAQLCRLPRDELPSRFGPALLTRLDQALGLIEEPLVPVQPVAPIVAARRWDEPVESLELIWPVAKELIARLAAQLLRRGHGAREFSATLRLAQGEPIERTIRLSRPSRDEKKLFDLLQRAVERSVGHQPAESIRATPEPALKSHIAHRKSQIPSDLSALDHNGFVAIRLEITRSQPVAAEQITLGGGEEFAGEVELADLVERLRVRGGDRHVARVRPVESYVPERAFEEEEEPQMNTDKRRFEMKRPQQTQREICFHPCSSVVSTQLAFPNPPLYLRDPVELRVIVSPSHDRDGRPVMVALPGDGETMPVRHSVGPTRVAGQWWTGHDKSRDYFDVELPDGRRWWVFRVNETGRWFWQGEF